MSSNTAEPHNPARRGVCLPGSARGQAMWIVGAAAIAVGISGPFIGVLGIAVGVLQTVGSVAALVGSVVIALAVRRSDPARSVTRTDATEGSSSHVDAI